MNKLLHNIVVKTHILQIDTIFYYTSHTITNNPKAFFQGLSQRRMADESARHDSLPTPRKSHQPLKDEENLYT